MKRTLLALLLSTLCSLACAQTASLSWTAVTTDITGTVTLTGVSYNVYQGTQGASACTASSLTKVQSGVSALAATISAGLTAGTTQCFAVSAVANGVEGGLSNIATAAIPFPTPGTPSQLTVVVH